MSLRAHHWPGAIVLIDRDAHRREPLAASLKALGADLEVCADLDTALGSELLSAERPLVLVALERHDGATASRLRSRNLHTTIVALALDDRACEDSAGAPHMKGRELLAMAQNTGCDGCLFYTAPAEIPVTLGALWDADAR